MCILFLSACSPEAGSVKPSDIQETTAKDLPKVYQHAEVTGSLKVEDVLARALRYNLDARVAEMDELITAEDLSIESLNALPSVKAKIQRVGRNNRGGSSSLSLLTGLQSLQPSISSDQYRNTQLLNVEWNLLDAGITLGRARSTADRVLIAQERRRKIYHNIVQDAYAAFWRVAVAQAALPMVDDLIQQSDEQIGVLDEQVKQGIAPLDEVQGKKATLLEKRKQLSDLKQGVLFAEIELKTLIDYPLDKSIAVDPGQKDWLAVGEVPKIKGDVTHLEQSAFMNRPELREEILNKRISVRDIKLSIIETFPGADIVLGFNRDSNSFLANKTWIDGVIGLTQSINKIITAPARYDRAKKVDELSDRRRQALVAAIMTQVRVAKARFDFLSGSYGENEAQNKNAQDILKRILNFQAAGMMSKPDVVNARIDAGISTVNRALAYAELQEAYGRFITTMGVDIWDADNASQGVPEFASQIRKNLSREDIFLIASDVGKTKE